jgi:hypothetical protein
MNSLQEDIDLLMGTFSNSPETLSDREFVLVFNAVQDYERKPKEIERYKNIIMLERQKHAQSKRDLQNTPKRPRKESAESRGDTVSEKDALDPEVVKGSQEES